MEYEIGKKKNSGIWEDWEEFCDALVDAMYVCETPVKYVVEENEVHNKHDKGYKYLLSIKKNFIDFAKTFMKIAWNEEIKEEDISLIDKEFITVDFDKKESDLIYEVEVKAGKVYFVLVEIQSKVDRKMAYRLLNYMVEIWRKWEGGLKSKKKRFCLPKIIPCVLYTGKEKWTAPIEFKNLYNDANENEDYLINFKYILIDVHRYKPEDLLEIGNVISSAFYLETSTKENMKDRLITLTESFANADKEIIEEFKRWLVNSFVIDDEKNKILEEKFVKEEEDMSNLAEIGKEIYDDGVRDGLEQGLQQGRKQEKLFIIKKLLSNKLKKENNEINLLIEDISIEKIEELENKIFEIETWEEVEEILSK